MFKVGDSCVVTNASRGTKNGPGPSGDMNPLYKQYLGATVTVLKIEPIYGTVAVSVGGTVQDMFPWRLSLDMLEANE